MSSLESEVMANLRRELYQFESPSKVRSDLGIPDWPPSEIPGDGNEYWWRDEIYVPMSERREEVRKSYTPTRRGSNIFIITGLPGAGKSTTTQELGRLLRGHVGLFVVDEGITVIDSMSAAISAPHPFSKISPTGVVDKTNATGSLVYDIYQVERFETLLADLDRGWPTTHHLRRWLSGDLEDGEGKQGFGVTAAARHLTVDQRVLEMRMEYTGPVDPSDFLIHRSVFDSVVWMHVLATYGSLDPMSENLDQRFVFPKSSEIEGKPPLEYATPYADRAVNFLRHIDGLILMGIGTQKAAQQRRGEKEYDAWVTDSKPSFWEHLSRWYGYFAKEVLPRMREHYGTGYMTLDGSGNKSIIELNAKKITRFMGYQV